MSHDPNFRDFRVHCSANTAIRNTVQNFAIGMIKCGADPTFQVVPDPVPTL
jgi:hypothetical protein